jgi:type IV secretion system protein TrbE
MVSLASMLRDYREAGALNSLIAIWGFVGEGIFLTKSGHLGIAYQLRGPDPEGLTYGQRRSVVHHFEAALRLLDERNRVYQYVIKRTVDPFVAPECRRPVAREALRRRADQLNAVRRGMFLVEQYLILVFEPPTPLRRVVANATGFAELFRRIRTSLSTDRSCAVLEAALDTAIVTLQQKATAVEVQLADVGLRRLGSDDTYRFFRQLVNYDDVARIAPARAPETHLDYFIADSAVECHRDHLMVGQQTVRVLSMKEPPSQTTSNLLDALVSLPAQFIACLEWQRCETDRIRRDIQSRRRHFFNKRVSLVNYVSSDTRPEEMLVDDSAGATVHQLGDALTEIEVQGHFFGMCSLTVVLHGDDRRAIQSAAAEVRKVLAAHDGRMFEESYNLLNAWLSVLPGNGGFNLRRLALLETNAADLSFLFSQDVGTPRSSHLDRPALAVFETPSQQPYYYNLHVDDVGHTLVLGATGSGKSFLLNFLITHLQQYDPLTVVLDLGHSYRKLATLLEGGYLELGLRQQGVSLNPFDLDKPSPEQLHFLHVFTRVLLEGEDGYRLSEIEDRETYEAIENLFVLDQSQRRLFTLASLLPHRLGTRLHRWVEGGRYGAMFDNDRDTLVMERLQFFDLESMRDFPMLLDPLLLYVLHRFNVRLHDPAEIGRLKVCVMDEAWTPIEHPLVQKYVRTGLKTWRKWNAALVMGTPSIEDFAAAKLMRAVVEGCPTRLLLANPAMDRGEYRDLLQMNEIELDLLAALLPRHQVLLKRSRSAKVLNLRVDPKSYWIYTNTPIDNERVAATFRDHGFAEGLDRLAASA